MYSAYKLNKQGDIIQPWRTPFPIWNQSVVPCPALTVTSWPAYRLLSSYHAVFCGLSWVRTSIQVTLLGAFSSCPLLVWGPQFLFDFGRRLPSAPSCLALSIWHLTIGSFLPQRKQHRERLLVIWATVLYSIIKYTWLPTFCYLWYILLTKTSHRSLPQKAWESWTHSRFCLSQCTPL